MNWNFDEMRDWIKKQPGSPKIKRLRLNMFDIYRYCEEYEKIYQMIEDLKKKG